MKRAVVLFKKYPILWTIALASLAVPFMLSRYYQGIVVQTLLWAGMSSAWNLYSGFAKRVCIGHAAFLGLGAYTSTILYLNYGLSPWIGMLGGAVVAAIAALVIGIPTLRLKGTFFVLSTIAFAKLLEVFAVNARDLTNGTLGLFIPHQNQIGFFNMIFADRISYAVLAWFYMIIVLIICCRVSQSKLGYSLVAVGENQEAAENLGVDSARTMLTVFVMSSALTACGGTIFAQYFGYIDPHTIMGLTNSINFILYAIAGGMGTVFGPMVGTFILCPLGLLLRGNLTNMRSGLHVFVLALILILILLFRPDGILPQIHMFINYVKRIRRRGADAS